MTAHLLLALATALPLVWAWQLPPLPAFYSQVLACALWALAVALGVGLTHRGSQRATRQPGAFPPHSSAARALIALWVLLLVVVTVHGVTGLSPWFAVSPVALNLWLALGISATVLLGDRDDVARGLTTLLWAALVAAWMNALVVALQAVAPNWTDDVWIARPELLVSATGAAPAPRPGGNLRQPNQLATLMVWGLIAAAHLLRHRWLAWLVASVPLLLALVASGSRAGVMSLFAVAVVAVALARWQRRDPEPVPRQRTWLRLLPWLVVLAVVIAALWQVAARDTADQSLAQRIALWRETVTLIGLHPWTGVGWSQLNFVWTLTPFAARPADVFDHAHSLPLHLAVELGLPVAIAVLALTIIALTRVPRALRQATERERTALVTAMALLLAMLLHSLVEYPLWFSYFFLPVVFVFAVVVRLSGLTTGATTSAPPARDSSPRWHRGRIAFAVRVSAGVAFAVTLWAIDEYGKATAIHRPGLDAVARGHAVMAAQRSPLYGQFGDYAEIMLTGDAAPLALFARPVRHLLDERLIAAWARALAREGETEKAAYVVARAREFAPDAAFAALPAVTAPARAASSPLAANDFR